MFVFLRLFLVVAMLVSLSSVLSATYIYNKVVAIQAQEGTTQPYQQPAGTTQPYQQPAGTTQPYQQPAGTTQPYQQPAETTQPYQQPAGTTSCPPGETGVVPNCSGATNPLGNQNTTGTTNPNMTATPEQMRDGCIRAGGTWNGASCDMSAAGTQTNTQDPNQMNRNMPKCAVGQEPTMAVQCQKDMMDQNMQDPNLMMRRPETKPNQTLDLNMQDPNRMNQNQNQDNRQPMDNRNQDQNNQNNQKNQSDMNKQYQDQNGGPGMMNSADFKRFKNDIKRMGKDILSFEKNIDSYVKKGLKVEIPQEVTEAITQAKSIIETVNKATKAEDLGEDFDRNALFDVMPTIMNARQEIEQQAREQKENEQRLKGMKSGMNMPKKGLKMFEKQIAQLTKKGIKAPVEMSDTITKIKAIIAGVEAAKTWDEAEAAGIEDMQDLFMSLDESRQQLEVLMRWPQIEKQMKNELAKLNRELKKAKATIDSLKKKGQDFSEQYNEFAAAVSKLQGVLDDAKEKVSAGDAEEVFSTVEEDFYGQLEDVWEQRKLIEAMKDIGKGITEYKQWLSRTDKAINSLTKREKDTAEANALFNEIKEKFNDAQKLTKEKPLDADAVWDAMEELTALRDDVSEQIDELSGRKTKEEERPWEIGPQKFQRVEMGDDIMKMLPMKSGPENSTMGQPQEGMGGEGSPATGL